MQPLYGHVSQETAYLVLDYPYGRKVRTQIRFWVETDKKKGSRFCSQTLNPNTQLWNNPKKSSYYLLGACMFLADNGHCEYCGISGYSRVDDILKYVENFPQAPISDNLKFFIAGRTKVCETLGRGEAVLAIGGVPQIPKETEITEAIAERDKWLQVRELVKGR